MLYKQIKESLDKLKQENNYDTVKISVVEFEELLTELNRLETALDYYSKGNDWDFGATAREVLHGTIEPATEVKEGQGE